jgi:threonyl-tRNA synthetase
MIAVLTESCGGKWPFWLSPRQAMVIPVAPKYDDYAEQIAQQLYKSGFCADADLDHGDTLNKKIRNAQLAQYNFILVVGQKEVENKTANVRTRDNVVHGEHDIPAIIDKFKVMAQSKLLSAESDF